MVTAAEIQSIDFTSNSCVVRIPFFETVNTIDPFTLEAKICIPPGVYNGYQVGDTVWVDFIDDIKGQPLVIGKIYQGAKEENTKASGAVHSSKLITSNSAKLPKNTTFENVDAEYNSISKIINKIKTATKSEGQPNVTPTDEEFTNELWIDKKPIFKQVFIWEQAITQANTFYNIGTLNSIPDTVIKLDYVINDLGGASLDFEQTQLGGSPQIKKVFLRVNKLSKKVQFLSEIAEPYNIIKLIVTVYYTKK